MTCFQNPLCQLTRLSSLNLAGTQTACAYMHSLSAAVDLALYTLYIRVPNCVASSMRMAYIVTKMNAFSTNITLSHIDTSSTLSKFTTLIS